MENKIKDFFISYTNCNEQWALWIAGTLEKAGYKTIVQAWDFKKGQDFVAQMHGALNSCNRFIPVLSKEYLSKTGWSQREWTSAFAKDRSLEKGIFIPVWIEYLDAESDDLGLFATINAIRLYNKDEEAMEKELLDGVSSKERPRNRPSSPGTKRVLFSGEMPFNNLQKRNVHFTGREEILEKIHTTFEKKEAIALTQAITGLGGIGKTQVVLEYAYRYGYEYEYIWWINAENEDTILASYQDFALMMKIIDEDVKDIKIIIEAVHNWMQQHDKWLFIYDNAEEFEKNKKEKNEREFENYLPQQNIEYKHVLITSRNRIYWKHLATVLTLEVFKSEESTQFLTHRTGLPKDLHQKDLAERLGNLSLALEQAGAYICNNDNCDYKKYLSLLDDYHLELFKDSPDMLTKQSVHATWNISFKKITNESSKELLNLCAFFAPENIFKQWFQSASKVLPKKLRTVISNDLQYNKTIAELTKYSLVNLNKEALSIHRLVQEVIRDSLKQKQTVWRNFCINILNELLYYDFSTIESRALFRTLATHIESITNGNDENATKKIARLYSFLGVGFYELADYPQALKWDEKAKDIYEKKFLGDVDPDTANTYFNIATVHGDQGNYKLALEYYDKALEIQEDVLGKKHSETLATYNNIAVIYDAQSNYDKALEYHEKALGIRRKDLDKVHPEDTATTYNNIGITYYQQGNYERSLEYYSKALDICEKVVGKVHPLTAKVYGNLANIYHTQGDYDRVLEYLGKALDIEEKVLGKEHPDTAYTYNDIGNVYHTHGNYNKALEYFSKALEICEKVLGEKHPLTATVYNNIAELYREYSIYDLALKYHEKAKDIREKTLGKEHPDTALTYNNIALVYYAQGDYDYALEWFLKALLIVRKVLDETHPTATLVRDNIAIVYEASGKREPFDRWMTKKIAETTWQIRRFPSEDM